MVGEKKTKLMLYSTLVEVEVGVELGKIFRLFIWKEFSYFVFERFILQAKHRLAGSVI